MEKMVGAKELAERKAKLINGLAGNDEIAKRLKYNLYLRYGDLAQAIYVDPVKEGLIRGNPEAFGVLTDLTIYTWAYTSKQRSDEFKAAVNKYPELDKLFTSVQELQKGITKIASITGISKKNTTFDEFVKGLSSYNPNNIIPLMDNIEENDEEIDIDMNENDYFNDGEENDDIIETDENVDEVINDNIDTYEEEELDPEVEANTARVLNVYRDLFEVGFELQIPYGILVKEGILRLIGSKTIVRASASFSRIYELINDITGKFLVQSTLRTSAEDHTLRDIEMRSGTTYYPEFQLGNLYGILGNRKVDSWEALSAELKPEIRNNIRLNMKAGRDIASIVNALTTCIVISEFKNNVDMKLRINIGHNMVSSGAFASEYAKRKNSIMAGTGELEYIKQLGSGVIEATIVFNKAAYNGRPLFAYEAVRDQLRRGRHPSIKEMILGQDTSGKILTINLNRQNSCITLIGAGPRSGKGVLTLNLLGTILADGHPLVYLDGKPDMAKVLWNVGAKNGVGVAVWDAFNENGNPVGIGAPDIINRENRDILGILMYLKALQLMIVAAHLRATKNIMVGGANKRPFFIFDEVLAIQSNLSGAMKPIVAMAKDKKNDSEEAKWCRAICQWAEQLNNSLVTTMNSQLPKSGISTVWLFQAIQPTTWNQFDITGLTGKYNLFKNPIMARTSIKMLGRGSTDSEYGLGHRELKEDRLITEYVASEGGRHFALTEAQKVTSIDLVKIFKPYLVLNEAENGSSSVEELRNNVSRDVWDAITINGQLDQAAGFEGFAKLLGSQAINNLQNGRIFLEEVMRNVGLTKYNSIEEYLYDASIDSFKSTGTLLNDPEAMEEEGNDGNIYVPRDFQDDEPITFETTKPQGRSARGIETPGYTQGTGIPSRQINNDRQFSQEEAIRNALDYNEPSNQNTDNDDDLINAVKRGDMSAEDAFRIIVEKRNQQATIFTGRGGRENVFDSKQTKNCSRLTRENSIDCRDAGPGPLSWIEKLTLDTPAGAQRYIEKVWKSILDSIISNGYKKVNITRVSLHGGQMYINGKIVNLNGVLGGYECVRLRDIVSYKTLFKTFFMTRELRIDEEMLRVAVMELGDNAIEVFFNLASKLEVVYVQASNGVTTGFDRSTVQSQQARRMISKSKAMNDIDLHCEANKPKAWASNPAGTNIWGMRLAKNALGSAGKMFLDKNKPSIGKAAIYATTGLVVGTIGTVAWGAFRLAGKLFSLGQGFKKA